MTEEDAKNMISDRLNTFTLQLSEHLSQTIRGEVKNVVNGKIDILTKDLSNYVEKDNQWKKEFKEKVDPALQAFEQGQVVTRIVIWCAKAMGFVGGGVIAFLTGWEAFKRITGK